MKNLKKNSIILLIITFVVLVCVLKDDFPSIIETLKNANFFWIVIALLCFFIAIAFEARVIKKLYKAMHISISLNKPIKCY